MPAPLVVISVLGVAKKTQKLEAAFGGIVRALKNLACKLEGSCRPKLLAACKAAGYMGYVYQWNDSSGKMLQQFYWKNGEWVTDWDSAHLRMVAEGYYDRLKATGISQCCLKNPPSEAFEVRAMPAPGWRHVSFAGYNITFDSAISEAQAIALIKQELSKAANGGENTSAIVSGDISAGFSNNWALPVFLGLALVGTLMLSKFSK